MTISTETATEAPVVKVGDFFVSSWGYDQTNVDFYKVVGLTKSGKSVRVQKWTSAIVGGAGAPQENVVPGAGPATGCWVRVPEGWSEYDRDAIAPVETKRLRMGGYFGASFTVNSFSAAYLWDGKPEYRTGSGWGH